MDTAIGITLGLGLAAAIVGTRALSTVMTAGFGNPIVALATIALLLPVLGLLLVVGLVAAIVRAGRKLAG